MEFRVVPIDESVVKEVRATMAAPGYGHPAWSEVPAGNAPCRSCLTYITPGVERLVGFTYDAFHGWSDLPLPGPIFVHERECAPYADTGRFPPGLRGSRYVLDAYGPHRRLIAERTVDDADAEREFGALLELADVEYLHVRSATAGCFEFAVTAVPARE